MESLLTFLQMGGYGGFVWGSFGATAIVMIGLLVWTLRTVRERQDVLERLQRTVPEAWKERRRET